MCQKYIFLLRNAFVFNITCILVYYIVLGSFVCTKNYIVSEVFYSLDYIQVHLIKERHL